VSTTFSPSCWSSEFSAELGVCGGVCFTEFVCGVTGPADSLGFLWGGVEGAFCSALASEGKIAGDSATGSEVSEWIVTRDARIPASSVCEAR